MHKLTLIRRIVGKYVPSKGFCPDRSRIRKKDQERPRN